MTITVTATLIVLVLGIIAIIVAATKESFGSAFWWMASFWVTCLALLGGIAFR